MKIAAIVVACLLGVATSSPLPQQDVQVVRSEIQPADGANFQYEIELDNGYQESRVGTEGSEGQSNMSGSFSIPLEDGTVAVFTYVADELGYRVERTQ
ncbi:unnamed protein product [Meganyctiphanes norvegica]|uniref:Uncharacterized protein n=1 Tax=Meganyctiphanes norvegica TaxID=48144 RepID=A0AAV2SD50_MEGNR